MTAVEMRISDWSSAVCSSDLQGLRLDPLAGVDHQDRALAGRQRAADLVGEVDVPGGVDQVQGVAAAVPGVVQQPDGLRLDGDAALALDVHRVEHLLRSEEHTSELQSLMRISYAVFCLNKKNNKSTN